MREIPTIITGAKGFKGVMEGARGRVSPSGIAPSIINCVGGSLCCFKPEVAHLFQGGQEMLPASSACNLRSCVG